MRDRRRNTGGEPLATLITKRQDKQLNQFAGVIFVKADSPVKSIEDIKGKRFMCAEKKSFGGYQMAQRLLKQHGVNPEKDCPMFKEAGTHEKVVEMVQKGVAEVGTVRSDTLEKLAAEGKCKLSDFRVLNREERRKSRRTSPSCTAPSSIPNGHLPRAPMPIAALSKSVAEALIAMPRDSDAAKAAKCAGWCAPIDYTSVVNCLDEVH